MRVCGVSKPLIFRHGFELQVLQTSEDKEPLTFEAGVGDVLGNKLFQVCSDNAAIFFG